MRNQEKLGLNLLIIYRMLRKANSKNGYNALDSRQILIFKASENRIFDFAPELVDDFGLYKQKNW